MTVEGALLVQLRQQFDQGFARPPPSAQQAPLHLLQVEWSGQQLALRLDELSGLHRDLKVVRLLGSAPEQVGLAAVRGVLVPVFDPGPALGLAPASSEWRWLAVTLGPDPVGFLFQRLLAYRTVAAHDLRQLSGEEQSSGLRQVVSWSGHALPLMEVELWHRQQLSRLAPTPGKEEG